MWHQWLNRNGMKLSEYFLCAKNTNVISLFNYFFSSVCIPLCVDWRGGEEIVEVIIDHKLVMEFYENIKCKYVNINILHEKKYFTRVGELRVMALCNLITR